MVGTPGLWALQRVCLIVAFERGHFWGFEMRCSFCVFLLSVGQKNFYFSFVEIPLFCLIFSFELAPRGWSVKASNEGCTGVELSEWNLNVLSLLS